MAGLFFYLIGMIVTFFAHLVTDEDAVEHDGTLSPLLILVALIWPISLWYMTWCLLRNVLSYLRWLNIPYRRRYKKSRINEEN